MPEISFLLNLTIAIAGLASLGVGGWFYLRSKAVKVTHRETVDLAQVRAEKISFLEGEMSRLESKVDALTSKVDAVLSLKADEIADRVADRLPPLLAELGKGI